jgi:hypothetical protein
MELSLPGSLSPSDYPTKVLYASLFIPMHATRPAHLTLLDVGVLIIQDV